MYLVRKSTAEIVLIYPIKITVKLLGLYKDESRTRKVQKSQHQLNEIAIPIWEIVWSHEQDIGRCRNSGKFVW